jgi:anti-sigma factor RsiW
MKWIWNRCRRRKQDISLLAAGAMGQDERLELERHLAACDECLTYYGEIKTLTAPLVEWEKNLSAIEATPSARMRWAKAVREAARASGPNPNLNRNPNLCPAEWTKRLRLGLGLRLGMGFWRTVWLELILPSRYAWSGMAALWVAMLVINGHLSDHRTSNEGARPASSQEMREALEEQNRILAELIQPAFAVPAPPPYPPRPRSQREQHWAII